MLESHLAALSFAEPAAFLVLADWLQSQQDPWGELIALQCANKPELAPRIAELIAELAPKLVGDVVCDWQYGFPRTATIVPAEPTATGLLVAMTEFLERPAARICDGLVFSPLVGHLHTTNDWDDDRNVIDPYTAGEALLEAIPARITRIGFGPWPAPPVAAYTRMPDFRQISGWLQRATELTLVGCVRDESSKFLLPNCTRLALHCADVNRITYTSLLASELPVLEHLTIGSGGDAHCILDDVYPPEEWDHDNPDAERYPPTYTPEDLAQLEVGGVSCSINAELGMLGAATNLPALEHLSLASSVLDAGCIEQIAQMQLLKQLETLDLSDGRMRDEDVRVLITAKDRFTHLKVLDLRRNGLTGKTAERIAKALPNALVGDQELHRDPSFFMRYVATME